MSKFQTTVTELMNNTIVTGSPLKDMLNMPVIFTSGREGYNLSEIGQGRYNQNNSNTATIQFPIPNSKSSSIDRFL